jgi:histidine triad (HIT) family protein
MTEDEVFRQSHAVPQVVPASPGEPVTDSPTPGCVFCERASDLGLLEDRLVYEDDSFHASHQIADEGPSYLGLVIVQTKGHLPGLAALSDAESERLGWLIGRISRAIVNCTGAQWTYCFGFTEGARHVQLLIAARYAGMPKEYVRLKITEWPDAPQGDLVKVRDLAAHLRSEVGVAKTQRG